MDKVINGTDNSELEDNIESANNPDNVNVEDNVDSANHADNEGRNKLMSIEIDGHLYYELYAACPICYEQGKSSATTFWEHSECGGKIFIGDDAKFFCEKCHQRKHISRCSWHTDKCCHYSSESDFIGSQISLDNHPNNNTLASMMSWAGQLVTAAGIPWLKKFMDNL